MDTRNTEPWRVGTKVNVNVYRGNTPVCQCQSAELAAQIVAAMNRDVAEEAVRMTRVRRRMLG